MLNVIFRFLDSDGQEKVSIGSYGYFKQRLKTAKQLIEFMGRECSDEERHRISSLTSNELANLLTSTLEGDVLHTMYPN